MSTLKIGNNVITRNACANIHENIVNPQLSSDFRAAAASNSLFSDTLRFEDQLIRSLYESGNSKLRKQLELVFGITVVHDLKELIDNAYKAIKPTTTLSRHHITTETIGGQQHVLVELPNCNTEWTFEAFDFVKAFVKLSPRSFPVHHDQDSYVSRPELFKNSEYLYIQFNQ
jgi:hypothetical protein